MDTHDLPTPAAPRTLREAIGPREREAVRCFVARVLAEVPADLVAASLFGSRARGDARPDSDVDVLLVFRVLPPHREPHAGHAEALADEVATLSGVPVTVWSVSLIDLEEGRRTPMLVDALTDAIPIWSRAAPLPAVPFSPADGVRCCDALLERVGEGSAIFARALDEGNGEAAIRRLRDDVVRLCTATHLVRGVTRPRRAEAVAAARAQLASEADADLGALLAWAEASFGGEGREDDLPPSVPPVPPRTAAAALDRLRRRLYRDLDRLGAGEGTSKWPGG